MIHVARSLTLLLSICALMWPFNDTVQFVRPDFPVLTTGELIGHKRRYGAMWPVYATGDALQQPQRSVLHRMLCNTRTFHSEFSPVRFHPPTALPRPSLPNVLDFLRHYPASWSLTAQRVWVAAVRHPWTESMLTTDDCTTSIIYSWVHPIHKGTYVGRTCCWKRRHDEHLTGAKSPNRHQTLRLQHRGPAWPAPLAASTAGWLMIPVLAVHHSVEKSAEQWLWTQLRQVSLNATIPNTMKPNPYLLQPYVVLQDVSDLIADDVRSVLKSDTHPVRVSLTSSSTLHNILVRHQKHLQLAVSTHGMHHNSFLTSVPVPSPSIVVSEDSTLRWCIHTPACTPVLLNPSVKKMSKVLSATHRTPVESIVCSNKLQWPVHCHELFRLQRLLSPAGYILLPSDKSPHPVLYPLRAFACSLLHCFSNFPPVPDGTDLQSQVQSELSHFQLPMSLPIDVWAPKRPPRSSCVAPAPSYCLLKAKPVEAQEFVQLWEHHGDGSTLQRLRPIVSFARHPYKRFLRLTARCLAVLVKHGAKKSGVQATAEGFATRFTSFFSSLYVQHTRRHNASAQIIMTEHDVSDAFTNISVEKALEAVRFVATATKTTRIALTKSTFLAPLDKRGSGSPYLFHNISIDTLCDLLLWESVVTRYITTPIGTFKQCGLPMGGYSSAHLCNLVFIAAELQHMKPSYGVTNPLNTRKTTLRSRKFSCVVRGADNIVVATVTHLPANARAVIKDFLSNMYQLPLKEEWFCKSGPTHTPLLWDHKSMGVRFSMMDYGWQIPSWNSESICPLLYNLVTPTPMCRATWGGVRCRPFGHPNARSQCISFWRAHATRLTKLTSPPFLVSDAAALYKEASNCTSVAATTVFKVLAKRLPPAPFASFCKLIKSSNL